MRGNPFFALGLYLLALVAIYLLLDPGSPAPPIWTRLLGSDGRCTGFPNGFWKWDWSACCSAHDLGGSDTDLVSCLVGKVPVVCGPLCFIAVGLMGFGRPLYNVMQRWGWAQ